MSVETCPKCKGPAVVKDPRKQGGRIVMGPLMECTACGMLWRHDITPCPNCGGPLFHTDETMRCRERGPACYEAAQRPKRRRP